VWLAFLASLNISSWLRACVELESRKASKGVMENLVKLKCVTETAGKTILEMAKVKNDFKVLGKIADRDLTAREAHYLCIFVTEIEFILRYASLLLNTLTLYIIDFCFICQLWLLN
jgi:hypothetical protein